MLSSSEIATVEQAMVLFTVVVLYFIGEIGFSQNIQVSDLQQISDSLARKLHWRGHIQIAAFRNGRIASKQVGHLAVCKLAKKRRALVVFCKHNWVIEDLRVIESVEGNASFSKGCWKVARCLHRGSHLGSQTAVVESWGSILARHYDSVQGLPSGRVLARSVLRIGGFNGDTTEAHVIDLVAKQIKGRPLHTQRRMRGLSREEIAFTTLMQHAEVMRNDSSELLISDAAIAACKQLQMNSDVPLHTLSFWRNEQKEWCGEFDVTELAGEDRQVFEKFLGPHKPSLPLIPMTKNQRL